MSTLPQNERERGEPEAIWRKLVSVQPGEGQVAVWCGVYFFCVLFAYQLLKPMRDQIGVRGELSKLPMLWTITIGAMLVIAPVFGFVVSRLPRRKFVPLVYRVSGVIMLVFYGLFMFADQKPGTGLGWAFYVWISVFNLFVVSVFWGVMADLWAPEQARRLFGAIGVGGTLGAIAGSSVPAYLATKLGLSGGTLMLMSIAFLELAVWAFRMVVRRGDTAGIATLSRGAEPGPGPFEGVTLVFKSSYLAMFAVYMLLFTIGSTFVYFEQAKIVKATTLDAAQQTALLARTNLIQQTATLVVQLLITGQLIKRLGVVAGLVAVPLVTMVGFATLGVMRTFPVFAGVSATRSATHYAIDRPARESLFAVVGPDAKYKAKNFIDTFVYRLGDLAGAGVQKVLIDRGISAFGPAIGVAAVAAVIGVVLANQNRRMVRERLAGAALPGDAKAG